MPVTCKMVDPDTAPIRVARIGEKTFFLIWLTVQGQYC
jgi:hypothetical protein